MSLGASSGGLTGNGSSLGAITVTSVNLGAATSTFSNNGGFALVQNLQVTNATSFSCNVTLSGTAKLVCPATDSSGTPGAATINKSSGQVAIAASAASVVVTNSLVATTSIVLCVVQTADATLTFIKSVVPASGSFTITGNANATANTKVGFVVVN